MLEIRTQFGHLFTGFNSWLHAYPLIRRRSGLLAVSVHFRDSTRTWDAGGIFSFKYTFYKEFVKWDDKIFAHINNTKLSLTCAVCLHKIVSENGLTFVQKLEHTGDPYTQAELSNTVVRSFCLLTSYGCTDACGNGNGSSVKSLAKSFYFKHLI
jgi:hypothetical protein